MRGLVRRRASAVLRLGWSDVRLLTREKTTFIWTLAFPIALMWIMSQILGGTASPSPAIHLDDRDGGWLGPALAEELEKCGVVLADSAGLLARDVVQVGTLVVPPGISGALDEGRPPPPLELEAIEGPGRKILPAARLRLRRAALRLLASRQAAVETIENVENIENVEDVEDVRTESTLTSRRSGREVRPVEVATVIAGASPPTGYALSAPGSLTWIVMMMTLIHGGLGLIKERRQRVLIRLATLPMSRLEVLAAKVLGRIFMAMLQIALLLATAHFVFGLELGRSWTGLTVLTLAYSTAIAGLTVFLGALLETAEQVATLGWVLSLILAVFGGCFWPSWLMPSWLATASHVFPTAWAMDGFHALLTYGQGLGGVALPSLVLAAFGAFFALLGARTLKLLD